MLALAGGAAGILLAVLGLAVAARARAARAADVRRAVARHRRVARHVARRVRHGLAFGVVPALAVGRADPQDTLREETRGTSESRGTRRLRGMLVAGQIALCLSLLAGAGLLARSLWAMTAAPLGFNPDDVLTVACNCRRARTRRTHRASQFVDRNSRSVSARSPASSRWRARVSVPTRVSNRNGLFFRAELRRRRATPSRLRSTRRSRTTTSARWGFRSGKAVRSARRTPTTARRRSSSTRRWRAATGRRATRSASASALGPRPETPVFTIVGVVGNVRNDPARPDAGADDVHVEPPEPVERPDRS